MEVCWLWPDQEKHVYSLDISLVWQLAWICTLNPFSPSWWQSQSKLAFFMIYGISPGNHLIAHEKGYWICTTVYPWLWYLHILNPLSPVGDGHDCLQFTVYCQALLLTTLVRSPFCVSGHYIYMARVMRVIWKLWKKQKLRWNIQRYLKGKYMLEPSMIIF